ncbi:MAG: sensor histidine kinase [Janthinobacterium lividum]
MVVLALLFNPETRVKRKGSCLETELDKTVSQRTIARDVRARQCLATEVARRKLAESQLQECERILAFQDQQRQEFLAMLGHELRNPLAPITTSLCMMRLLKGDDVGMTHSRQIIERQVSLMTRLINDLLDASRISLGKMELDLQEIGLADVVALAVEMARPLLDQQKHRLTVDLPPDAVILRADRIRLSQALANLLNNAAQYTASQGQIRLEASVLGDDVIFTVMDNGEGLRPEQRESIFELFSQGSHSMTQARGGLGVGLALARTIIELHHGQVHASSAGPGCGSEFTARIPLHISEPLS